MEYKDLDEQSLARCCREGDILAEDELYRRYAPKVYTLCRRYLNDGNEAKDLVQDSLIQALDKIHRFSFTGNGSLYNWIRRIAVNKAINHLKRNRWRFVPLEYWQGDSFIIEDSYELEQIPEEKILEWIASLTDLRRTVFNMYCIDGYSHKEIARMIGISEKGSAGVLAKARKQLKEKIEHYIKEGEQ